MLQILPPDKAQHFIAGAIAYLAGAAVAHFASLDSQNIGLAASVAAGAAKEFYDFEANRAAISAGNPPPHEVSFWDFAATTLGGIAMFCAAMLG